MVKICIPIITDQVFQLFTRVVSIENKMNSFKIMMQKDKECNKNLTFNHREQQHKKKRFGYV